MLRIYVAIIDDTCQDLAASPTARNRPLSPLSSAEVEKLCFHHVIHINSCIELKLLFGAQGRFEGSEIKPINLI